MHRYRLEQRLMQFSSGSRWQHRARYFMQVKWPVPNHPEWAVTAYEEAFIGLRTLDSPVSNLLQQNRMSVALNRKWEGGTSVQVGYLRCLECTRTDIEVALSMLRSSRALRFNCGSSLHQQAR